MIFSNSKRAFSDLWGNTRRVQQPCGDFMQEHSFAHLISFHEWAYASQPTIQSVSKPFFLSLFFLFVFNAKNKNVASKQFESRSCHLKQNQLSVLDILFFSTEGGTISLACQRLILIFLRAECSRALFY